MLRGIKTRAGDRTPADQPAVRGDQDPMNSTTTSTGQSETRIGPHPLIWYFALAYAISWPFWLLSHLAGGTLGIVFIVIGGFGPMAAAAIIISRTGDSLSEWLRSILRWRVSWLYYAYALGLPVLLAVILNLALATLGKQPDLSLVVDRIPAYLQTLLLTAVIFGGQEEPGWRGLSSLNHCLLVLGTARSTRSAWLRAGEALQRILLEATRLNFVVSLASQVTEVPSTRDRLRKELGLEFHPLLLMRIGRTAPTPASQRRDLTVIVSETRE